MTAHKFSSPSHVNGLTYEDAASLYTAQEGDTAASIAQLVWGDASLWYLIAEANGLSSSSTLVAGQQVAIPNKVHNFRNSADTWRPYDPNEAIGDLSPITAKKPGSNQCGTFGVILMAIVAVAVTILATAGATALISGVKMGAVLSAMTGGVAAGTAAATAVGNIGVATWAAGGAIGGAIGSLASQGLGIALGMQERVDWKGVGLAAVAGAVSGGLGEVAGNARALVNAGTKVSALTKAVALMAKPGALGAGLRGAVSSALTQGIGIATGLQKDFDPVGVAAAGVAGAVTAELGPVFANKGRGLGPLAGNNALVSNALAGMAGGVANLAVRSLLTGTDFGDNILAGLPDIIGNTVGNLAADGIASIGRGKPPAIEQAFLHEAGHAAATAGNGPHLDYDMAGLLSDDVVTSGGVAGAGSGAVAVGSAGVPNLIAFGQNGRHDIARLYVERHGEPGAAQWFNQHAGGGPEGKWNLDSAFDNVVPWASDAELGALMGALRQDLAANPDLANTAAFLARTEDYVASAIVVEGQRPQSGGIDPRVALLVPGGALVASEVGEAAVATGARWGTRLLPIAGRAVPVVGTVAGLVIPTNDTSPHVQSGVLNGVPLRITTPLGAMPRVSAQVDGEWIGLGRADIYRGQYVFDPSVLGGAFPNTIVMNGDQMGFGITTNSQAERDIVADMVTGRRSLAEIQNALDASRHQTGAKGFGSFPALKKYLGSPGAGNQWHHIVEQTPANIKAFGTQAIQSPGNVIAIPASVHIGKGSISAYYSSKDTFTGTQTVRQWLSTQSFEAQRQFGIQVLKRYGY